MNQRPVFQARLGLVVVGIFENTHEGERGSRTYFNTTLTRLYKPDSEQPDWSRSHSLGRDDLPLAAKVLDMAHTWIHQEEQRRRQAQREAS